VGHSADGAEEVQSLENVFVLRNTVSTVATTLASSHSSKGRLLIHVSLDFVCVVFVFNYMGSNMQNYGCALCPEAQQLPDPKERTVISEHLVWRRILETKSHKLDKEIENNTLLGASGPVFFVHTC